ncbi:MAG: IPExxxVDY family protein [Cytophagales bacterium]|nr:IPExxxVDY family protein [Cytophagales bacterium]
MRKSKLHLEDYFDFDLIGVVSIVKEYKLVWNINEITNFQLVKAPDISMEFSGNNKILISNFEFKEDHLTVTLLKNRLLAMPNRGFQFLVEELKQFDYLLKYNDETEQTSAKDIISLLKPSSVIEYIAILEPSTIKSRDNLIF